MKESTTAQVDAFYQKFKTTSSSIESQIDSLTNTQLSAADRAGITDECLSRISLLSNETKDANSFLPAYDLGNYSRKIKDLSERLESVRASVTPKAKFSFKGGKKNLGGQSREISNSQSGSHVQSQVQSQADQSSAPDNSQANRSSSLDQSRAESRDEDSKNQGLTVHDQTNKIIRLPVPSNAQQSLLIINIQNCLIQPPQPSQPTSNTLHPSNPGTTSNSNSEAAPEATNSTLNSEAYSNLQAGYSKSTSNSNSGANSDSKLDSRPDSKSDSKEKEIQKEESYSTLTLKNLSNSIIDTGTINGPIHLTNLEGCTILLACRQFRMHKCRECKVYLWCGSRPIIEDCKGVGFTSLEGGLISNQLLSTQSQNKWDQIDDFNWLRAEHSPNWRILESSEIVPASTWLRLRRLNEDGLEEALKYASV